MNSDNAQTFQDRISLLIEKVGGPAELARKARLSRRVIDKYRTGESEPSRDRLIALAQAGGASIGWLADGEQAPEMSPAEQLSGALVTLPRMATELSGGDGSFLDGSNVIGHMTFTKQWVKEKLGYIDIRHLCIVGVIGDSMEPTIHQGDDLMIDTSITRMTDNAIYAMQWDDALVVKRLQRLMDGLVIMSDNPAYTDQTIERKQIDRLRIVGRVRWIGKVL